MHAEAGAVPAESFELRPEQTRSGHPALAQAARFLRQQPGKILAGSGLLLLPCFWHARIMAGDLASHTYNAWLVQLIHSGQAPGLYLARQWNNVLFDWMLSGLGGLFGLRAAEKICVSVCVLVFFWGAFALLAAATRRAAWGIAPCLAMLAYGWTFQMGFFNYYLSLGLAFWALALFWRGSLRERLLALALAPLIWLAQPLGMAFLLGAAACVAIAEMLKDYRQFLLLPAGTIVVLLVRAYLSRHYSVEADPASFELLNGTDQFILFGERYLLLARAFFWFAAACLAVDLATNFREHGLWRRYALPAQLYALSVLAALFLPSVIRLPLYAIPISLITERLTALCGVLSCVLLATLRPRLWHRAGFALAAAVFFALLYQDTAVLNRMEEQAERLVAPLPPAQRVLSTILPPPESRVVIHHMVDRACIGRCYSYVNYEPSSRAFRVRALEGNPIVETDPEEVENMQTGLYEVKLEDVPAYQIYQCSPAMTELCIRKLVPGELNGRIGVQPAR